MERKQISEAWRVPDELWQRVEPLLPKYRRSRKISVRSDVDASAERVRGKLGKIFG